MLQIRNLTITHKKDLRVLLQDFSCVLNAGDKAVIIGEEGDGKSTLLKWICAPELIEDYAEAAGERIAGGERLAYLPQELPGEDLGKTVYEFFAEEPAFYEQTPKELGKLAKELNLSPEFFYGEQLMGTLSGGEKVKAQLMRLLLKDPTVLLLDEPSNDIDVETLEWMERMINGWEHIILFISHDETLIENTANLVIHIEQIRRKTRTRYTVVRLPYRKYLEERRDRSAKQEQRALEERREKKIRDEKFQRICQSVEYAQANVSRQSPGEGKLLKKKMHVVKSMERRFAREDREMTEMPEEESAIYFRLGDQSAAIPAGKGVIDFSLDRLCAPGEGRILAENVRLLVRGSEKICIVGSNGAGKTTLLRKMAEGLLGRKDIRAEYMPQDYEDLLDLALTPVDYLDVSGEKEERTRIRTYLGSLKYTADEMDHPIAQLSGGQKAKVLLLKMSLSGANVLLLDEPTRNFSPLSGPVIRRMLAEFPGAIISISHDRKYIDEVCRKVYRLTGSGLRLERE
ncbi:MAG: ATP-binding cassette domain-containing protein [Eubacterium sp.]|nr:ATP-binding cassette domain-containing protein [Eubacterium sp.]MCM1213119.1 ATP-binding cassette domain-containing protein [Lachnospiraceae bacterium]MCM1239424.1 ATP-binding cassette domain-containing protein [Lachnospiraceae bacterium]